MAAWSQLYPPGSYYIDTTGEDPKAQLPEHRNCSSEIPTATALAFDTMAYPTAAPSNDLSLSAKLVNQSQQNVYVHVLRTFFEFVPCSVPQRQALVYQHYTTVCVVWDNTWAAMQYKVGV